jgi:thymidylate synthase (FAD)
VNLNNEQLEAAFVDGSATRVHNLGFVRIVDTMGDDPAIVQAARVSYGKGTKTPSDDRSLIRYLMRHWHTTPFEMCEIKMHIKLPVFVARQWLRHRTANVNESSGRYSLMPNEFYVPTLDAIKPQSQTNKQGRDGELPEETRLAMRETLRQSGEIAFQVYEELHTGWPWADEDGESWRDRTIRATPTPHDGSQGMARELARINLPLSTYTEFYWKIDLHNLFHFLRLRADPHAQKEIRDYADVICKYVEAWCPAAYEAFVDYRLKAVTLSRMEAEALARYFEDLGFNREDDGWPEPQGLSGRESQEFFEKMGLIT